jgi:hypothetical protein
MAKYAFYHPQGTDRIESGKVSTKTVAYQQSLREYPDRQQQLWNRPDKPWSYGV